MAELEPHQHTIPLFTTQTLQENPSFAQSILKEYWKQQAKITRLHLEEMGMSSTSLESYSLLINDMVCQDSYTNPESFGTGNYENPEVRDVVETVVFSMTERVEPDYQTRAGLMAHRYFQEQERHFIYTFVQAENIAEVCMVNGGIPGWTSREINLLQNF